MALSRFKTELKVAFVVLGLGTLVVLLTWQTEPSYKGRFLSAWFDELTTEADRKFNPIAFSTDPKVVQAQVAIRHIGSDAVPFLIVKFQQHGVTNRSKTIDVINRVFARETPQPDKSLEYLRLWRAFEALGERASPAVPALEKLLGDPDKGWLAAICLGAIPSQGMKAAMRGLKHPLPDHRRNGLAGLWHLGTNANVALPLVLKLRDDPDPVIRSLVLRTAVRITTNTAALLPELMTSLKSGVDETRTGAANALGYVAESDWEAIRPMAQPVVEELTRALSDPDWPMRHTAVVALGYFREFALTNLPAIEALKNDTEASVRHMTTNSLKRLGVAP